jgi:hypothetical protein
MLFRYARHITEILHYIVDVQATSRHTLRHSNRRIRICTPYQGHTILVRYMDIHTTAGPHCTLCGYTHNSRATLYVMRIYTLQQGHIVRYTDIHTTAGPHCTLYGYTYHSRVTMYVVRIFSLDQGQIHDI